MTTSFTLAQFSDVHLSPLVGLKPRHLTLKRAFGAVNWGRVRRFIHRRETADILVQDALALNVDHVVVTGDLINLGLPLEYQSAAAWLAAVGSPENVTVIPGNHDVYAPLSDDIGIGRWAAYMGGDADSMAFPFVRRVGPLALVGLNSAVETPVFYASGRLGGDQIAAAEAILQKLGEEDVVRVVLIHHPPLVGLTAPRRALTDAAHFQRALEKSGAELVLYGHNHRARIDWFSAESQNVPVVAAASASAAKTHNGSNLASYNLFTFFMGPAGLRIRCAVRGIAAEGAGVTTLSETFLAAAE